MIYVSSGYEKGIGLEVFLKSFICLNNSYQHNFTLVSSKSHISRTFKSINTHFNIVENSLFFSSSKLNCIFLDNTAPNLTSASMNKIMQLISIQDIFLTLPSMKSEIHFNGKIVAGHTEYFREFYGNHNLTMNFLSKNENVLLLSDHISIDEVQENLNFRSILKKVSCSLDNFPKHRSINEVYFAGINPHCGESGQISSFDTILDTVQAELCKLYPDIKFHKQMAADTLHFNFENSRQLFVYAYHDQGLGPFKLKNGLIGINLTLGMPFKRVSVDHGTANNIYEKNCANYQGMLFLLHEILNW